MDFSITIATILAVFGALSIVMNGINIIKSWFKPAKEMQHMLSKNASELTEEHRRTDMIDEDIRMIYKCLTVLLECSVGKDCEENRKEVRDALNHYLIDR